MSVPPQHGPQGLIQERAPNGNGATTAALLAEAEQRESNARAHVRELARELADAHAAHARLSSALEARDAELRDAQAREATLRDELSQTRAAMRAGAVRTAHADEEAAALRDALTNLEAEHHSLGGGRDEAFDAADDRRLARLEEQLRALKRERRVLLNRAAKLEELRASRGHRFVRAAWRVKTAILRPFRAVRRRAAR